MVSEAWVTSKLSPYGRWLKLACLLFISLTLVAVGWQANGWRLGKDMAQLEAKVAAKEAARQTALSERQADAINTALEAVTASQAALTVARRDNARLRQEAARAAPVGPEWDCRDKPLPEDYLEIFRK